MSAPSTTDPQQATQARITELYHQFRGQGLGANEAAARAVLEIKKQCLSSSSSAQSSKSNSSVTTNGQPTNPESSKSGDENAESSTQPEKPEEPAEPDKPKFKATFATTSTVDFMDYFKDSSEDELATHIENIFAHPCNLSQSFQLAHNLETDSNMTTDPAAGTSSCDREWSQNNIDWDGLKRVYDEIENRGGRLEFTLIEAVKKIRTQRNTVSPQLLHVSIVMTLMNPHIASPSYLDSAFIGICRVLSEYNEQEQIEMVKMLSKLSSLDLLQIVRNVQQSLTIRCLEIDESIDVHEDERISCLVRTLRILFFAALLAPNDDNEDDWRSNLKKHSETLDTVDEVDSQMETDQPEAEEHEELPQMSEDERQINKILHESKEPNTSEDQDPLAKSLKLDWCNISRPRLPYAEFLNETVNNALDVEKDFVNYKFPNEIGEESDPSDVFSFMNNPFILNTKQKTIYLFYDSRVKQIQHRRRAHYYNIMFRGVLPYLMLKVSRDNIIQDALIQLEIVAADNPQNLQKQLVVEFDGEQGIDEGGVSKEFFALALEQILKPDYGMFRFNDDTGYHQFNPIQFQETEKEYMLIGMLLGLAIYNGINLDIAFPTVIFKKLMGFNGTFEDLEFSHPDVYRSMTQVLEADKDTVDQMSLTFSTGLTSMFGDVVEYDLVKNGKDKPVTNSNKFHFVEVYADFLLNKSIKKSFNAFKRGFELATNNSPLTDLFRPEELEQLVIGQRKYDWETLQEICEYDGGFNKNHETIKHFWSVFEEMDESEKKMLLEFFTGSDRVPVGGLSRLKPKIQSSGPDSDRLPTAHTCFNILLLPAYKSREKLKERLTKAIENAKGFGMI